MTSEFVPILSDDELLDRTMEGDPLAYGDLYDRYVDQLYRYVYFRVANRQEAEDLTELAFLKAWEILQQQDPRIANFQAWLFRTAHNLIIDHYRTRREYVSLDVAHDLHDTVPLPEALLLYNQDHERLRKALSRLDSASQQILTCRFVNCLTHEETARVMGLKEGHLRVLQFRALKKLRKIITWEHE